MSQQNRGNQGQSNPSMTGNKFDMLMSDHSARQTTTQTIKAQNHLKKSLRPENIAGYGFDTPRLITEEEQAEIRINTENALFEDVHLKTPEVYVHKKGTAVIVQEMYEAFDIDSQAVESSDQRLQRNINALDIATNKYAKQINDQATPTVIPRVTAPKLDNTITPAVSSKYISHRLIKQHKTVSELNDIRTPTTKYNDLKYENESKPFHPEFKNAQNQAYRMSFTPNTLQRNHDSGNFLTQSAKKNRTDKPQRRLSRWEQIKSFWQAEEEIVEEHPSIGRILLNMYYPKGSDNHKMKIHNPEHNPTMVEQIEKYDEYNSKHRHRIDKNFNQEKQDEQNAYINSGFDMNNVVDAHEKLEKPINYYIPTQYDALTANLDPNSAIQRLLRLADYQKATMPQNEINTLLFSVIADLHTQNTALTQAVQILSADLAEIKTKGVVASSVTSDVPTKSTLPTGPRPAFLAGIGAAGNGLKPMDRPPNPFAAALSKPPVLKSATAGDKAVTPTGGGFDPSQIRNVQLRSTTAPRPIPERSQDPQASAMNFTLRKTEHSMLANNNKDTAPFGLKDPTPLGLPQKTDFRHTLRATGLQPDVKEHQVIETRQNLRKVEINQHKKEPQQEIHPFQAQLVNTGRAILGFSALAGKYSSSSSFVKTTPSLYKYQPSWQHQSEQQPQVRSFGRFQPNTNALFEAHDDTTRWTPGIAKIPPKPATPATPQEIKAQQKRQFAFNTMVKRNLQHSLEKLRQEKEGTEWYDEVGGSQPQKHTPCIEVNKYIQQEYQTQCPFQPPTKRGKSTKKQKATSAAATAGNKKSKKDVTKAILYNQDEIYAPVKQQHKFTLSPCVMNGLHLINITEDNQDEIISTTPNITAEIIPITPTVMNTSVFNMSYVAPVDEEDNGDELFINEAEVAMEAIVEVTTPVYNQVNTGAPQTEEFIVETVAIEPQSTIDAATTPPPSPSLQQDQKQVTPTIIKQATPTIIKQAIIKQVTPTTTKQVTPTITKQVTPTVSKQVTPTVTKQVTPTVTKQVTPTTAKHSPTLRQVAPNISIQSSSSQKSSPATSVNLDFNLNNIKFSPSLSSRSSKNGSPAVTKSTTLKPVTPAIIQQLTTSVTATPTIQMRPMASRLTQSAIKGARPTVEQKSLGDRYLSTPLLKQQSGGASALNRTAKQAPGTTKSHFVANNANIAGKPQLRTMQSTPSSLHTPHSRQL